MEPLHQPVSPAPATFSFSSGTDLDASALLLFLECPRCFYLTRRFDIHRPHGCCSKLHEKLEQSLHDEFDHYRTLGKAHPLMQQNQLPAMPLVHEKINLWRDTASGGLSFEHQLSSVYLRGAVDDIWINHSGLWHLVAYETQLAREEVDRNEKWNQSCKRKLDLLAWLFNQNGFPLHETHYFVLFSGITPSKDKAPWHTVELALQPYNANSIWVEEALFSAQKCLSQTSLPPMSEDCAFCRYQQTLSSRESVSNGLTFTSETI